MRCLRVCIFSSTAFRLGTLVSCFCTFLRSYPDLFRPAFPALAAAVRGAVGSDLSSLPLFSHPLASFSRTSTTSFSLSSALLSFVFAFFSSYSLALRPMRRDSLSFSSSFSLFPSVALPPQKGGIRIGLAHQGIFEASTPLSTSQTNWDGWIRTNHTRLSPSLSLCLPHTQTHLSDTHEPALTTTTNGGWRMAWTVHGWVRRTATRVWWSVHSKTRGR